jgi:hypothetical protein
VLFLASRDVVFDVTVFPFATLHPNAGAQLRAEISLLPSNFSHLLGGTNERANVDANPPNYIAGKSFAQESDLFPSTTNSGGSIGDNPDKSSSGSTT